MAFDMDVPPRATQCKTKILDANGCWSGGGSWRKAAKARAEAEAETEVISNQCHQK